jgi:hypothetical protein
LQVVKVKELKKLARREGQDQDNKFLSDLIGKSTGDLETALTSKESQILRELTEGIRSIGYGSIVLVVHAGRLVEVTKTERIRANRTSQEV